jgi:hypothetical protein
MKHFNSILFASLVASSLVACGDNAEPDPMMQPDPADPAPVAFPASCMEAGNGKVLPDGDQKLYFQNNEQQAWTAYCHDGNEYLTLDDSFSNYGELGEGGLAVGTTVRTQYKRIRIDAETLTVDVSDQTYATSIGHITVNGVEVTSMPLGIAMACGGSTSYATTMIDVHGTPFAIATTFAPAGTSAKAGFTTYNDEQTLEGWAEGECGFLAPEKMVSMPVNKLADGYVLKLTWKK